MKQNVRQWRGILLHMTVLWKLMNSWHSQIIIFMVHALYVKSDCTLLMVNISAHQNKLKIWRNIPAFYSHSLLPQSKWLLALWTFLITETVIYKYFEKQQKWINIPIYIISLPLMVEETGSLKDILQAFAIFFTTYKGEFMKK